MIIAIWLINGIVLALITRGNSKGHPMPLIVWLTIITLWPLLVIIVISKFLFSIEL